MIGWNPTMIARGMVCLSTACLVATPLDARPERDSRAALDAFRAGEFLKAWQSADHDALGHYVRGLISVDDRCDPGDLGQGLARLRAALFPIQAQREARAGHKPSRGTDARPSHDYIRWEIAQHDISVAFLNEEDVLAAIAAVERHARETLPAPMVKSVLDTGQRWQVGSWYYPCAQVRRPR